MSELNRCGWASIGDPLYLSYHDHEWGTPLHDDRRLFELLTLEGDQAGLSWKTILSKRENFRKAFDGFNVKRIAAYDQKKIESLMEDAGIIRNRLKIKSAVKNANAFLRVVEEYGSFDNFIWKFTGNKPIVNSWSSTKEVPARTEISDEMSRELVRRGFSFVGSTICYAYMQATGIVNDHTTDCFRYGELASGYQSRNYQYRTNELPTDKH
ncbi:MAG: DNA-3-methyladenine glycosylase I [Candidatus Thermoplasmatota archaeon]|nr:DNA-3-methyladenine glycosylase I [Candidatus Thermoplasmatota archaeon]